MGTGFLRASIIALDGLFFPPPTFELITEELFNGTPSAGLNGDAPPVGMGLGVWNVLG